MYPLVAVLSFAVQRPAAAQLPGGLKHAVHNGVALQGFSRAGDQNCRGHLKALAEESLLAIDWFLIIFIYALQL